MAKFDVPETAKARMDSMAEAIKEFQTEYTEFKEKTKKVAGARSKKALTKVKKLITAVRRDIQEEIYALSKKA
jgi:hypothetical protein